MGIMKGPFLTVLALFVASCHMKTFLIETGSAEANDYLKLSPGYCQANISWIEKNCKTRRDKNCTALKKSIKEDCGVKKFNYQDQPKETDYIVSPKGKKSLLQMLQDSANELRSQGIHYFFLIQLFWFNWMLT